MRAEMEEQARRGKFDKSRQQNQKAKEDARKERLLKHVQDVRETHRKMTSAIEQKAKERSLIVKQKEAERASMDERKKMDLDRIGRAREANIETREAERRDRL